MPKSGQQPTNGNIAETFATFFLGKVENVNQRFLKESSTEHDERVIATPPISVANEPCLSTLTPASLGEVMRVLRRLPLKSSPADVLPLRLLKADEVLPEMLQVAVNTSFADGIFPSSLKHAVVTPILKKHNLDSENLANFRPISNISQFSKVSERIAASRLCELLEKNCLHKFQSAYRRHHSTETATLRVSSDWRTLLASGHMVCIVSLDVTAAFDTVDHKRLLMKLYQAGVEGTALRWCESYLCNRSMVVKAGNCLSETHTLSSGVPQGSVLGPIFFNVYIAGLAHLLDGLGAKFHLYADDLIIYDGFDEKTLAITFQKLQMLLNVIDSWMWTNKLLLSPTKTSVHLLRNPRSKAPVCPPLHLGGIRLDTIEAPLKWLGVLFDPHLSMTLFVQNTCRSSYCQLRTIRHVRPSLTTATTTMLCDALVHSRLRYCNTLLAASTKENMNQLDRVLKASARVITQKNREVSGDVLMHELRWCSAQHQSSMGIIRLVHLSLCQRTPSYLPCHVHIPRRHLRATVAEETSLEVVISARTVGNGAWEVIAPSVWNGLPRELRVVSRFSLSAVEEHFLTLTDI